MTRFFVFIFLLLCSQKLICQSAYCSFELVNYDFEQPDIVATYGTTLAFVNDNNVDGWATTASDHQIEIWHTGFDPYFNPYSGQQFVELNANMVSALYQDIPTIPGTTLTYGFAHRGRLGVDVMELKIGPSDGTLTVEGTYSTDRTAWRHYTGAYTVPAGQRITRFYFSSVSGANGDQGIGNFLDDINIQDIDITMELSAQGSCGNGRIDVVSTAPQGVLLEYSIDNINFQSQPFFTGLATGNYMVYLRAGEVCMRQKSISLSNSAISVDLGLDRTICAGETVSFSPGAGYTSYQWNTGETSDTIVASTSGKYKVTVSNASGCSGSDSVYLTVNPKPVIDLGANKNICEGKTYTFDAGTGFYAYKWNTSATSRFITTGVAGKYTVEVTSGKGCKMSDSVLLSVNSFPVISIGPDVAVCDGDGPVKFTVTAQQGLAFQWNTGDTGSSIVVDQPGQYIVLVTNSNGCSNADTVWLQIKDRPEIEIDPLDIVICETSAPLILDGGEAMDFYLWSTGENTQQISVDTSGKYILSVSKDGCDTTVSVNVEVEKMPTLAYPKKVVACEGEDTEINIVTSAPKIVWSTGETTSTIKVSSGATYSVVVSNLTCEISAEMNVVNASAPNAVLEDSLLFCFQKSNVVALNATTNVALYQWQDSSAAPVFYATQEGNYKVTLTSSEGCVAYDSIAVREICPPIVYVPNAFSVNADGVNEIFYAYASEPLKEFHLMIFNRWGEELFESYNIQDGWDGTYKGINVAQGVYVWKIDYSYETIKGTGRDTQLGHVSLIR